MAEQLEFDFRPIKEWFHGETFQKFRDEVYLAVAGQIEQGMHPIMGYHNIPGLPDRFTLNAFGYQLPFMGRNPAISLGNTIISYRGGIGVEVQMVSIDLNPRYVQDRFWWRNR
jgi:hypothetical protein